MKGANALTPMKEDVTHRMANLLDRMDDSDIGDSKQAGGRVQLPPRSVIRYDQIACFYFHTLMLDQSSE